MNSKTLSYYRASLAYNTCIAVDDKVYFGKPNGVYQYAIEEDSEKLMIEGEILSFELIDDKIYYSIVNENKIFSYNIKNGEIKSFHSDVQGDLICCIENNILIYDSRNDGTSIFRNNIDEAAYKAEAEIGVFLRENTIGHINECNLAQDESFIYFISDLSISKISKYENELYKRKCEVIPVYIERSEISDNRTVIGCIGVSEEYIFFLKGIIKGCLPSDQIYGVFRVDKKGGKPIRIYEGYVKEMQVQGNYVYFLDGIDEVQVFRMDFNGNNLEIIKKEDTSAISVFEEKLVAVERLLGDTAKKAIEEYYQMFKKYIIKREHAKQNKEDDEEWDEIKIKGDEIIRKHQDVMRLWKSSVDFSVKIIQLK